MPAYDYSAYNTQGKQISGVIDADSDRHARKLLRENRMMPVSVSRVTAEKDKQGSPKFRSRVSAYDLSLLLRQQAILIQSGLPLAQALKMTVEQAETRKQKRLVQSWHSELLEGRSFADALKRSPARIPENVVAGVEVGEESGHLSQVLMRMADELEVSAENRKTLTRALIYPLTLIATSIVVVAIMMVWVVPKIIVIFQSGNRDLPLVTRLVISSSNFFQAYGLFMLVLVIALFVAFKLATRIRKYRLKWHALLLQMPVIGRWIRMGNIADWSRSLGILLSNGVSALTALKISSTAVNNLFIRTQMEAVTEAMRQGKSLHKALSEQNLGSGFLVHMVASGEASSELDAMLQRVADYYSMRLRNAVDVFLKILNPVLIVLMGGIILSVVAAVMLPIMDMNNMI